MRAKRNAEIPLELGAQFSFVVDLTIIGDGYSSARVAHRLPAGRREIADCQSPMSETDGAIMPDLAGIRAAMRQHAGHPRQNGRVNVPAVELKDAGNTAHELNRMRAAGGTINEDSNCYALTIVDCRGANNELPGAIDRLSWI